MKKLVSLLLCVFALAGLLAVTALADTGADAQFSVTADKTNVVHGDEITYTVSISCDKECVSFGAQLKYDANVFEVVTGECVVDARIAEFDASKGFVVMYTLKGEPVVPGNTVIGTFVLKVKDTADAVGKTEVTVNPSVNVASGASAVTSAANAVEMAVDHKWNAGEVITEASCGVPSETKYTCTGCGAVETKEGAALEHSIIHFDAVEPGCHSLGNIEYWFCKTCEVFWQDAALTQLTNSKNVNLPAKGSDKLVHFDAVEPGCHSLGNIEYWHCPECEGFWTDAACTQLTNSKNVNLPAKGSDKLVHVEAVAANCWAEGNVEYWHCPDCEGFWTDEACTQLTNSKNIITPALNHAGLKKVEAIEPGCHMTGNIEHYYCTDCRTFWQDAAMTQVTNALNVVLPAKGSENVQHFEAVEATCHGLGNIEYWFCPDCEGFWQDEACTQLTNSKNVNLPAKGSENLKHVAAVAPTTEAEGNIEYWYCPDCGAYFQDEACTQLTNAKRVLIPRLEKEPTTTPATGDATPVVALVVLTVAAAMGMALVVVNKKKFA